MHEAEASGFVQVGRSDLDGFGDGMQVMVEGDVAYVGHFGPSGMATSVVDVSRLDQPRVIRQWRAPEGGHCHKTQVADGLLLTNYEAFRGGMPNRVGLAVHDLSDPTAPAEIGFWDSTGKGVHRIVWEGGRYAYVSATPAGFGERIWVVIDLSDPERPTEAGRWWWPGMADDEAQDWPADESRSVHHAMVEGDRAFVGFWDSGLVILDIADLADITVVSHLNWEVGGHTHTALPLLGRHLVAVTDEAVTDGCADDPHMVRLVDISDERNPTVVSICPVPDGDFCDRGLRFGAHCLHENRPGSYQSDRLLFVTYFNAGLRVFDTVDPAAPVEVAHWIPACPPGQAAIQINDVFVASDHTVWATDRVNGGLYALRPDERLASLMTEAARPDPR